MLRNSFHLALGFISIAGAAYMLAYPQFSTASVFTSFRLDITSRTVYIFTASALFFLIYLGDVIVFFVNRQNRSLHDLIGKTYVVKRLG